MKRTLSVLSACLLIAALLAACGNGAAAAPTPTPSAPPASEAPAPTESAPAEPVAILAAFTAEDLEGNEVDQSLLSDYNLTMVNVWATFCGPCLKEMPELGELNSEYADQKFQVVGIVSDVLNQDGTLNQDQIDTAREIVSSTSADYLHLLPTADLLPIVAQAYAVPMTFFVDKDGNLVGEGAYMGAQDKAGWSKIIDAMLEEVAA